MTDKRKIEEYGKRIVELEKRIAASISLKEKIISKVAEINLEHSRGRISAIERDSYFSRIFEGQSYADWINYYEKDIAKSREIISNLRSEIRSAESAGYAGKAADRQQSAAETRNNYIAIFLILAAVFGFLAFAGMPEGSFSSITKGIFGPKASLTGHVVVSPWSNLSYYLPNQKIENDFNFSIQIKTTGDNIPNNTLINVTLGTNSSMIWIENFILNSSGTACYNRSYGTYTDVDNIRNWEGKIGYGFGRNATGGSPKCTPTGDYSVNLSVFFPTGLYAPSVQGTYNITFNATYNRSATNPEIVLWTNIEFNVTEKNKPAVALMEPLNNTYNNSEEINFVYNASDDTGQKNCTIILRPDGLFNYTNTTIANGTASRFNFSSFADDLYNWSINCTDNSTSYNTNESIKYLLFLDRTGPTITTIIPANSNITYADASGLAHMNFSWNITDKMSTGAICNLTFNDTMNLSDVGVGNRTRMNHTIVNITYGNYTWNVTCWDNATNLNTSTYWTFEIRDNFVPTVDLSEPLNNTYNNSEEIVFSYTPRDNVGLLNCSIQLNGDGLINYTNHTVANNTLSVFNFSHLVERMYNWSINCTDNSSNYNANRSTGWQVVVDRTVPAITIIQPQNYSFTTDEFMNISWNVTDMLGTGVFCNLTINGTGTRETPLSRANASQFNYTNMSMPVGLYLWNLTCWDNATNSNSTETWVFNVTVLTVTNIAPPDTAIVGIMDDNTECGGTPLWDKTNNDTHMDYAYGPVLNWTEGTDQDADGIKTRICIGTTTDAFNVDLHGNDANVTTLCDVLNAWANASAIDNGYVNLTNATFTYGSTSKTFYSMFMPIDDNAVPLGGNVTKYNITILNTAPATSSGFKAASTNLALTHINTTAEVYKWGTLATDADDGSAANKCPADTVTHNASVGTSNLDTTYFGGAVANPATGFSLTTGIPWGTSVVDNTVNVTVYANFGACDNHGLCEAGVAGTFKLYNTLPTEPTVWNMTNTHDPTPMVGWTNGTDVDGDNITYYIVASLVQSGDTDLMTSRNTSKPGDSTFWDVTIPWGTDNATDGYANDTIYVRVWSVDNITKDLKRTTVNDSWFVLGDYLPDVTAVYMTDSAGYSSCADGCTINPKSGTNASNVAIQVNWTELDADCNTAGNAKAKIYLCAYTLATDACDEGKYNYTWLFEEAGREGTNCWVNFSVNRTATDGTPPFWLTNSTAESKYALWVNASDQAAPRKAVADAEANTSWIYGRLASVNFTASVLLGAGTSAAMDTWNNATTGYLLTNFGNDIINLSWNASDATSPSDTWTVNGTNFEIDDDNEHIDEDSGAILAQNLTRPALTDFFPSGGLDRCLSDACSSAAADETLVLYWHIAPTQLLAGDYRSNITYYVNTFGS